MIFWCGGNKSYVKSEFRTVSFCTTTFHLVRINLKDEKLGHFGEEFQYRDIIFMGYNVARHPTTGEFTFVRPG
jgi:hypothetical protein